MSPFPRLLSRTGPTSVHSFDAESQLLDQLGFQNEIEQCKYIVFKFGECPKCKKAAAQGAASG